MMSRDVTFGEATPRLKLAGLHRRTVAAGGLMQGFDYLAWSVVGLQVQSRLPVISMHGCQRAA